MGNPKNHIGTAFHRGEGGEMAELYDVTATNAGGMMLDLSFVKKGETVFTATLECVPYLAEAAAKVLDTSEDSHVWVKVPNGKADHQTLIDLGFTIPMLRQQFAEARAKIDQLERELGLLPLPLHDVASA